MGSEKVRLLLVDTKIQNDLLFQRALLRLLTGYWLTRILVATASKALVQGAAIRCWYLTNLGGTVKASGLSSPNLSRSQVIANALRLHF
jgi:hypothetical protein